MTSFQQRIHSLLADASAGALKEIRRGIEKESLRVTPEGKLAQTPHPRALGSALTHPEITTDYAECLLEFITPALTSAPEILGKLDLLHRLTYHHIGEEMLWVDSMPCQLVEDSEIPVAQYGSSNIGRMKTAYRIGLGHRYGRSMQTIAGIHYNFSLPDSFWRWLQENEAPGMDLQLLKDQYYLGLIRNFRRNFWILLYLFGASPAVCRSFVRGRAHHLVPFEGDEHSLHAPLGTSLRMGDLGYQSNAQQSLFICYNDLSNYISSLKQALTQPYSAYEKIGTRDNSGNYQQLSPHLLQIENEFYSVIRPKRTTRSGETPLNALAERGVEYIEVRCLDLNPYLPLGISEEQIYFLDTFLLYCLLQPSPQTDHEEYNTIVENQRRVVYFGRRKKPHLREHGRERQAREWAESVFNGLAEAARLLDAQQDTNVYSAAIATFRPLLENPDQTPSGSILQEMRDSGKTYFRIAMGHAEKNRRYFTERPLSDAVLAEYRHKAEESLARQKQIESSDSCSFDDFLAEYFRQYEKLP